MEDGNIVGRLDGSPYMVVRMDVGIGSEDEDIRSSSDSVSSYFNGEDGLTTSGVDELSSLLSGSMRVRVVMADDGDVVELQQLDAGVDR